MATNCALRHGQFGGVANVLPIRYPRLYHGQLRLTDPRYSVALGTPLIVMPTSNAWISAMNQAVQ